MKFNVETKIYGTYMGVRSGEQGGRAPLDFHTWYRISVEQI